MTTQDQVLSQSRKLLPGAVPAQFQPSASLAQCPHCSLVTRNEREKCSNPYSLNFPTVHWTLDTGPLSGAGEGNGQHITTQ